MSARQQERYYWLKLPNDFFDNHTLRILRGMEGGQYALLLYIELLAESVTRDGRLRCSEKVPYNEAMIASMFGFSEEQVNNSFSLLKKFELMVVEKDGTLVFPQLGDMVGNETKDAARKRLERSSAGQKEDKDRTREGQREETERTERGKCPLEIRDKSTEKRDQNTESESSLARTRDCEVSSSVQPYVPPKHDAPTWEEVKRHISNSLMVDKITEAFAREFYETAVMSEWRDTKGQDMRPSYVWKRKLQLQWNELLKEQRKANGGMTDAEKLREKERKLERDNDALRRNNLADKQELEEMYESLDWLEEQKKKAEAEAKAKADAEAKAALADRSHQTTQEKAVA